MGFSLPWPCGSDTVGGSHKELYLPHCPYGLKGLDHMNINFSVSPYTLCLGTTTGGGGGVLLGGLCNLLPTPLAVPAQGILTAALARSSLPCRAATRSCIYAGPGIFYLNGVSPALRDG